MLLDQNQSFPPASEGWVETLAVGIYRTEDQGERDVRVSLTRRAASWISASVVKRPKLKRIEDSASSVT